MVPLVRIINARPGEKNYAKKVYPIPTPPAGVQFAVSFIACVAWLVVCLSVCPVCLFQCWLAGLLAACWRLALLFDPPENRQASRRGLEHPPATRLTKVV